MITLTGAGAIVEDAGRVLLVRSERRGMRRWELPTRIARNGESTFLTLYRCIEQESASELAARIGRPVCLGINTSRQLGYQFYAMFFACTVERLTSGASDFSDVEVPPESRQKIFGWELLDWRQLEERDIHPQHRQILAQWDTAPDGPMFAVASDADSELAYYQGGGTPQYSMVNADGLLHASPGPQVSKSTGTQIARGQDLRYDESHRAENVATDGDSIRGRTWDVFVSHASEDKDSFVRSLVERLRDAGVSPWYDEWEMSVGQLLIDGIERGLLGARFGIMVISPKYLEKEWARREADALLNLAEVGRLKLLPVLHGVSAEELKLRRPTLARHIAVDSADGGELVAKKLIRAIQG